MIPHPLVEIWWHDAHPMQGWAPLDQIPQEPRIIRSTGYLVRNAVPNHHFIVQSIDVTADTYDAGLAIPNGMVTELRFLAEL
jgi:hypothetical protein